MYHHSSGNLLPEHWFAGPATDSVGDLSSDQFAFWTAFCSRMPLFDRQSKGAVSSFLSILVRHLQIRLISTLSSGSCFPPSVAIKSASLASGRALPSSWCG